MHSTRCIWMLLPPHVLRRGLTSALCLAASSSWPSAAAFHVSPGRPRCIVRMSSSSGASGGFTYRYPRPSVTVDTLVFCLEEEQVKLLLVKRGNEPFKDHWAVPGGFADKDESLDAAAARELQEETALDGVALAQCASYGDKGRDPRGHTVTVAYAAVILSSQGVKAGDDAKEAQFFAFGKLPPALAFDHRKIIEETWARLGVEAAGDDHVVKERGTGQVLCALPTPALAEIVRRGTPFPNS